MAATFAQLAAGMSERDAARLLMSEMDRRGAAGDGLVQFGPSSALPHDGPAGVTLQRERSSSSTAAVAWRATPPT